MNTVLMHGPAIGDPDGKLVERDVPECDIQAYKNAGYVEGGLPEQAVEEKTEDAPKKAAKKK